MTQPTKKGVEAQIEKIVVLLDQRQKADLMNASVKFKNLLKDVYETEVNKLETMLTKGENKDLKETKE